MSFSARSALPAPPSVVIVDADRRVADSLADLLGISGEVRVVGRAGDVRCALETVARALPDVVLIDPRLPDVEAGIALISGMTRAWPRLRIVLTGWADPAGDAPVATPSARYVSKGESPEAFAAAIARACALA